MADNAYRFFVATKAQLEQGIERGIIMDNYLLYIKDSHEIYKGSEKYGGDDFVICSEKPEEAWEHKLYCIGKELFRYVNGEWVQLNSAVETSLSDSDEVAPSSKAVKTAIEAAVADCVASVHSHENKDAIDTYNMTLTQLIELVNENIGDATSDKADADAVYTKAEVDSAIAAAVMNAISPVYTASQVDEFLNLKADKETTYTKTEVDALIPDLSVKADKATTYTKEEVDNLLLDKANGSSVYSKDEVDGMIPDISGKADADSVYTKEEVEGLIPDISGKADKSSVYTKDQVDSAIAAAVTGSASAVYTSDQVDKLLKDKADSADVYGKDEVDAAIAAAVAGHSQAVYTSAQTDNLLKGKADASAVYTKEEVDALIPEVPDISGKADKADTLEGYKIKDAYTKSQVDALIPDISGKADKSTVYTKAQVDALIPDIDGKADKATTYTKAQVDSAIAAAVTGSASAVYTASQVDELLSSKADKTNVYTKTQVDNLIPEMPDISVKADKSNTYTKAQVDAMIPDISGKANSKDVYTKTQVDELIPDISGKADKTSVYTKTQVDSLIPDVSGKADKSDTYTKAQVDSAIAAAVTGSASAVYTAEQVDGLLKGKADVSKVYSKAEVDAMIPEVPDISGKADKATTYTKTEVDALIPDVSGKADSKDVYTKEQVDAALSAKANATDTYSRTDLNGWFDDLEEGKANKSDVYTKAQVDSAIAAAVTGSASAVYTSEQVDGLLAGKADASTTYSKAEVDARIPDVSGKANASDVYTKTQVDTELGKKADAATTYSKSEVDARIPDVSGKANAADVYTKTQVDTALGNKADAATTYSKTEVDALIPDISGKANSADVYTKTQVDTALGKKADASTTYTKTQVDALIPDISGKANSADVYTKTQVNTELAKKADASNVYTKSEEDAKLALKADKGNVYTKSEVDVAISNAVKNGGNTSTVMPTETLFNVNSNMYHSYRRDGYRAQTFCYNTVKKVWYIIGGPTTGDGTTRIIEVADLRDFPSNPLGIYTLNCGHANDSTFNADTQMLYITTGYDASSSTGQEGDLAGNLLCEIDTNTMELVRYITIPDYTMVMKVEWHAGLFYIGDFTHGSIYDGNFTLVEHIPSKDVFSWSDARAAAIFGVSTSKTGTQGIAYINGEIHAAMWGCTGKFGADVKDMGIVYRYALTGEYIGYYMISPKRFGGELEAVAYKDGAIYSLWYGDNIDIEIGYVAGSVEEQGNLLREGDDLDDCRAIGPYHCTAAATCATLKNVPFDNKGFTLYTVQAARSNLTQIIVQSAKQPEIWMRTWYDKTGWEKPWFHVVGLQTDTLNEFAYCNGFLTNACKDVRFMVPSFNVPGQIESITITSMNMYVRETGRFLFSNKMIVDPNVENSAITIVPGSTTTVTLEDGATVKFVLYKTGIRVIYTATAAFEGYTTNTAVSVESTIKGSVSYMK